MSSEAVVDAEVVRDGEVPTPVGTELAAATAFAVTTPVQASDLVERLGKIREAMDDAMEEGVDYGKIPGTDKPTLFKPGAEKLAVMFRLDVQTTHDEKWGPGDHLVVPAYTMIYDAPTGTRLGRGEGMCSTRERKYAYRNEQRKCPTCNAAAIIKGKAKYGGGWVCFNKKGGCEAKFKDGDQAIEGQVTGEIDNPDLPDLWNTVIKMARKRAITDAVLLVTGASALFTQDAEDLPAAKQAEPVVQGPPFGPDAPDELRARAQRAIGYLVGTAPDGPAVKVVIDKVRASYGYLPVATLDGIILGATSVAAARGGTGETQPENQAARGTAADVTATDEFASEFSKPLGGSDE
jgi:hypothetical protein